MIQGWARNGLTDEQIAGNMGISRSTLNEWKGRLLPLEAPGGVVDWLIIPPGFTAALSSPSGAISSQLPTWGRFANSLRCSVAMTALSQATRLFTSGDLSPGNLDPLSVIIL